MAKTPKKKPELRVVEAFETAEQLFLKGHTEIPPCPVELGPTSQALYDNYCRMLLKRGMLTVQNVENVKRYCIADDLIIKAYAKGKVPARNITEMQRAAEMRLNKLGLNDEIQTPASEGANPFASFGFAKRSRQARDG